MTTPVKTKISTHRNDCCFQDSSTSCLVLRVISSQSLYKFFSLNKTRFNQMSHIAKPVLSAHTNHYAMTILQPTQKNTQVKPVVPETSQFISGTKIPHNSTRRMKTYTALASLNLSVKCRQKISRPLFFKVYMPAMEFSLLSTVKKKPCLKHNLTRKETSVTGRRPVSPEGDQCHRMHKQAKVLNIIHSFPPPPPPPPDIN